MGLRWEIGGYLELERFEGSLWHDDAIKLNCGRDCLEYLVELRGIEHLWMPDYLCESVAIRCARLGVTVSRYRIEPGFELRLDMPLGSGDWLYLVDHYGFLTESEVDQARSVCSGRLIVDESQGFFRPPWAGVDTLYTCRKWFGVPDGAYVHTADGSRLARPLEHAESCDAMGYVLGRFERSAGEYFAKSKENNARFADEPMQLMSPLTMNILRAVNYESVLQSRWKNFASLHQALGSRNDIDAAACDSPFMYPFAVRRAEGVRAEMASQNVFVPTLWPNVLKDNDAGPFARYAAENILPLPIDQRYGNEEMDRIVEVLTACLN